MRWSGFASIKLLKLVLVHPFLNLKNGNCEIDPYTYLIIPQSTPYQKSFWKTSTNMRSAWDRYVLIKGLYSEIEADARERPTLALS